MSLLENLNPAQKKAVEQIYGPVLVLAGPGTGKTHLLTARIAHILEQTDANPQNLLCLTFTNAAAIEMRERLRKTIGPAAYRVWIGTFHSFAEWVMERYPEKFLEQKQGRELADDLAKALAFQTAVKSQHWKYFRPVYDELADQNDVLQAISKLKREHVSPEKFRELIPEEKKRLEADPDNLYQRKYKDFAPGDWKPHKREQIDRKVEKMEEFSRLWEAYEDAMKKRGGYDFDDLIDWVTEVLGKDEALRLDLQEQFQWVLVDEYQDTNTAQNEIVWALTDYEQANVFAVGDDDQSIYRFQGASTENIRQFREKFPDRVEIALEENYRSGQNILDAAFASVRKNIDRADPDRTLTAAGENRTFEGKIERVSLGSRAAEQTHLVEQIREAMKAGTEPNEIAVLVRKNREIEELAKMLPRFGIPVAASLRGNIFDDEHVRRAVQLLKVFLSPELDDTVFDLLHAPWWDIPAEELLKLSLAHDGAPGSLVKKLLEKNPEGNVGEFLDFLAHARKNFWHARPEVLSEKLLYDSGMMDFLVREQNTSSLAAVRKLLDWITDQRCEKLEEILERVTLLETFQIKVRPDPLPADQRSVHLLTAHGAKGREFDVILIPGLCDRTWGNPRGGHSNVPLPQLFHDTHEANEEERRLFFVALTRARKKIALSHATQNAAGRDTAPSMFWYEIPEGLATDLETEEIEEKTQALLPVLLRAGKELLLTSGEKTLLQERARAFVWSATALQNYLECPRRFLFQNLYRMPRNPRPEPQIALGIALHEALERTLREEISLKKLQGNFERALRGQNLSHSDFTRLLQHGGEILEQNFTEKSDTWRAENVKTEFQFGQFSPDIQGIRVTGKADKIVFLDDGKTQVKIVDYKSGKPRPIREGERAWRQLVFYDLLARASKQIWTVQSCELEFLTPDSAGKLGSRVLEVSGEDRKTVTTELKTAHEKIQNLEFPLVENPENDPDLEFWQNFGK